MNGNIDLTIRKHFLSDVDNRIAPDNVRNYHRKENPLTHHHYSLRSLILNSRSSNRNLLEYRPDLRELGEEMEFSYSGTTILGTNRFYKVCELCGVLINPLNSKWSLCDICDNREWETNALNAGVNPREMLL